jgi:tRNA G18 (ribose-2'-O)-methylase SpoU
MAFKLFETYNPSEVDIFRSLKGKAGLFEKGLFIAESPKIVRKIFESNLEIESAFLTPEYFAKFQDFFQSHRGEIKIFIASKPEMEHVVGYPLHQGVMLAVKIPISRSLRDAALSWREPFVILALDGIADAENMGAIIRNAAAFGVDAILIDSQSCSPYLRRSVRVSMGTIAQVEIVRVPDLCNALLELKELRNVTIIGAALTERSIPLSNIESIDNTTLVFGSEGWGIRKEILNACNLVAKIPIAGDVDSLNVSIANGIFLYEFAKNSKRPY